MHDPINRPDHYTKYPVEVIEITRHLGFCLGNATKYVLRAPWKGGVEDCDKALWYLRDLECHPQTPLLHWAYASCRNGSEKLQEFLLASAGDALWRDISHYQAQYLREMKNYLFCRERGQAARDLFALRNMGEYVAQLKRILGLRDTTGQIYEGLTGLPELMQEEEE